MYLSVSAISCDLNFVSEHIKQVILWVVWLFLDTIIISCGQRVQETIMRMYRCNIRPFLMAVILIFLMWKVKWSTWLEHASVAQQKIWVPDRNRTHDRPNTGQMLYPLSYGNSWKAKSFKWVHMGQASYILLGSSLLKSLWLWIRDLLNTMRVLYPLSWNLSS